MSTMDAHKLAAFQKACTANPVVGFTDHRAYLQALYSWLKAELRSYSYLGFAEDLGFSRTNVLYLVISGRRPLTVKAARRIAEAIHLESLDRRFLETLVRRADTRVGPERDALTRALNDLQRLARPSIIQEAQLELFSAWHHPVILGMMALPGFRSDPAWIATSIRPEISHEEAAASLRLLERLGLATFDSHRGRHIPAVSQLAAGDDVLPRDGALAPFHRQSMALGLDALTQENATSRDFSSVIVGVSAEAEERLKGEIRRFRQQLVSLARESPAADRVVQINLQLFPVSNRGD